MRTIRDYVDTRAAAQPQAPYLIAPESGTVMTYGELRSSAQRLTWFLLGRGLTKGDKVALMLPNGYQTARLLIGIMYGGFTAAPLNLLSQPSQLGYVLGHSDTRLVLTTSEFEGRVRDAASGLPGAPGIIVIDSDAAEVFDVSALDEVPLPEVSEGDECLLMYTSGTTGVPKGVLHTHRSVAAGGEYTSAAHRLTVHDRVLCALPLYHINGQIVTAVAPLVHGGSVVMPQRFSVSNYWSLVANYRCTWINVVPTIIAYLLNAPAPDALGLDVSSVRFCRSASAPLPPELHRAFEDKFGISVIETFGMTETNAPCFTNPCERENRRIGSPGQAFGNEAKIVDPATGTTLPARNVGEIMVRGDNVMKCYYKDPDSTSRTLDRDGWMRSGDLGYLDEDGFLYVTGRIKELIIKGGENIAPREIDEALLRHPCVLEAAAVGIPDPGYGQDIMACVVLKPGSSTRCEELSAFCERELGRYKTPKLIRILDALPKGPSGKVQRLKLLETHE